MIWQVVETTPRVVSVHATHEEACDKRQALGPIGSRVFDVRKRWEVSDVIAMYDRAREIRPSFDIRFEDGILDLWYESLQLIEIQHWDFDELVQCVCNALDYFLNRNDPTRQEDDE